MENYRTRWWRHADLAFIIVILTLCGMVWGIIQEPVKWNQTTIDVEEMKPKLESLDKRMTSFESRNEAQMTLIIRELDGIHKSLKQ